MVGGGVLGGLLDFPALADTADRSGRHQDNHTQRDPDDGAQPLVFLLVCGKKTVFSSSKRISHDLEFGYAWYGSTKDSSSKGLSHEFEFRYKW